MRILNCFNPIYSDINSTHVTTSSPCWTVNAPLERINIPQQVIMLACLTFRTLFYVTHVNNNNKKHNNINNGHNLVDNKSYITH